MTAKRFTIKEFSTLDAMTSIDVICDNGIELPSSTACDLLNELHDEKQSVIKWIDNKIEEIKPYNSELCRATLLELKELLE